MNDKMIENWNTVVKENEIVFHLGDFGDYEFAKKLNGKIHLLLGNYERTDDIKENRLLIGKLEKIFERVTDKPFYATFDDNQEYLMEHEPSHGTDDIFKLFSHIHKLQMVKRNALNVGVDCHNFTPICLKTVGFYRNAIEKHYDEEVFN